MPAPRPAEPLVAAAPDPWPVVDHPSPGAVAEPDVRPGWYDPVKAALDFLIALLLLPAAVPLVVAGALAVKLTSAGPAFYTRTLLGRGGRPFHTAVLRTVRHGCAPRPGARWPDPGDARVTPVGRVLRAAHVDVLPQLLNVLVGHMSLVGPRPGRPEVARALGRVVPGYCHRLLVRPGVTGLAQLQAPADATLTGSRREVAYDLYYVQHHGLWLDLRVLLAAPLRAAGVGPRVLRRVFGLPGRDAVAGAFPAADRSGEPAYLLAIGVP